ncbi:unnamed protein product [Gordionus sp. m RMFG-2023]
MFQNQRSQKTPSLDTTVVPSPLLNRSLSENPFLDTEQKPSTSREPKNFFAPEIEDIPCLDLTKESTEFILSEVEIRTLNIMAETEKINSSEAKHFLNVICLAERMPGKLKGRDLFELPSLKIYVREISRSSMEYLRDVTAKAQTYAKLAAWG